MNKKDCKIVQDLLPNYVDKLTNKDTNEFIEKHLNECGECKKRHEEMNKQIDLNFKVDDREIKPMKKINKKIKIMGAAILVLVIIVAISLYINYKSAYLLDAKTGKIHSTDNLINNDRYIFIEYNSNYNNIDIDTTIIAMFGDDNIIKNVRIIEIANNQEGQKSIEDKYNIINGMNSIHSNAELRDNKLSYNYNKWNAKAKDDILNELKEYNLNIIEY